MDTSTLPVITGPPIDPRHDKIMPLADLARTLGCRANTVYQWTKSGRLSADRQRIVKLSHMKIPSGMVTTLTAYYEFIDLLSNYDGHAVEQQKEDLFGGDKLHVIDGNCAIVRLSREDIRWICNRLPNGDRLRAVFCTVLGEFD